MLNVDIGRKLDFRGYQQGTKMGTTPLLKVFPGVTHCIDTPFDFSKLGIFFPHYVW